MTQSYIYLIIIVLIAIFISGFLYMVVEFIKKMF
jgi:hypothetical protein